MATLIDAMAYVLGLSESNGLPNARLTKLLYLADWHLSIKAGRQVTPVQWYFDNYGPFVWDVIRTAEQAPDIFEVAKDHTAFGNPRTVIRLKAKPSVKLTAEEQQSLSHVVATTAGLSFEQFLRLVYSTHPIVTSQRYSQLDLRKKADEYKATQAVSA